MPLSIAPEVQNALAENKAVVALESTVISHGLPYPQNIELAHEMEAIVRAEGATPATIAMIDGVPKVGISEDDLMRLGEGKEAVRKLSRRDLGSASAKGEMGATTVAATMLIAHWAGVRLFATGGIGGVHRGDSADVSADLIELSQTPVAVVCAGAKAILDLPRTLEFLETYGVPVVGYDTDELPAFYTPHSGLELVERVNTPDEAAALLRAHWGFGLKNGVLFTLPIPAEHALDPVSINAQIEQALASAHEQGIRGKAVTPFLLDRLVSLSDGESLSANLALLKNNGRVAAQIAKALLS